MQGQSMTNGTSLTVRSDNNNPTERLKSVGQRL
jgi:hypothetical protein